MNIITVCYRLCVSHYACSRTTSIILNSSLKIVPKSCNVLTLQLRFIPCVGRRFVSSLDLCSTATWVSFSIEKRREIKIEKSKFWVLKILIFWKIKNWTKRPDVQMPKGQTWYVPCDTEPVSPGWQVYLSWRQSCSLHLPYFCHYVRKFLHSYLWPKLGERDKENPLPKTCASGTLKQASFESNGHSDWHEADLS